MTQQFKDQLTHHLTATGSTAAELAKLVGVGAQTLRDVLSGKSGGSESTIAKVRSAMFDQPVPAVEPIDASTTEGRLARVTAAKAEHAALRQWEKQGRDGDKPASPNLDAIQTQSDGTEPKPSKTRKASARQAVVHTVDGQAVQRTRAFTLGYMAYECTAKIGGDDVKRITAAALVALLADLGVTDPHSAPWEVVLPNGTTVGAVLAAPAKSEAA